MSSRGRDSRGFTLLEMMVVVAILGVMSSLAVGGMRQVIVTGRVNGAAGSLARMMSNTRLRALSMGCRTSIQLNGPGYAPTGMPAGFPARANMATVFMKQQCDAPSADGFFEPGDHVIATFSLADQYVRVDVPGLTGGALAQDAVLISWGMDVAGTSGVFQRDSYTDPAGTGVFVANNPAGDLTMNVTAESGPSTRAAVVPPKAPPYLN